jgi:hypothetical protein
MGVMTAMSATTIAALWIRDIVIPPNGAVGALAPARAAPIDECYRRM